MVIQLPARLWYPHLGSESSVSSLVFGRIHLLVTVGFETLILLRQPAVPHHGHFPQHGTVKVHRLMSVCYGCSESLTISYLCSLFPWAPNRNNLRFMRYSPASLTHHERTRCCYGLALKVPPKAPVLGLVPQPQSTTGT